jgi:Cu-Zn family superoxide dismutase
MRLITSACAIAALGLVAACATVPSPSRKVVATATLLGADGGVRGNAKLVAVGDRLDLEVEASGLSAGMHGIHLHTVGKCVPGDFASAGGHFNPGGRQHGSMNPQGSHAGDLPNLSVSSDGKGALTALLPGARAELDPALFDADGSAIVIHADPDDYMTDPSGKSGGRIACGVFAPVR